MLFYLGTHQPHWLAMPRFAEIPLFVSRRRLENYKALPRARMPWALDSGGFTELNMFGEWRTSPAEYVDLVYRFSQEVGRMVWAAPQDWMCEEPVLAKTGLSVRDHIERTVDNLIDLRLRTPLPIIPVLQGFVLDDYLRCRDLYTSRGIDLTQEEIVGVGTICRRQGSIEAEDILRRLQREGIRLHAFGAKITGLTKYHDVLESADSLAWSFAARREAPLPGHAHKNCANCRTYALLWRDRVISSILKASSRSRSGWDLLGAGSNVDRFLATPSS